MNRDWMRDQLEEFAQLCTMRDNTYRASSSTRTGPSRTLDDNIRSRIPTVHQILQRLDARLVEHVIDPDYMGAPANARAAIQQALGILRDQDAWKANLQPDTPSIDAGQFHPAIWGAAAVIWDTGQFRVAVAQAAVALSARIAGKAQSHLTERELVNEVLAISEPPPGKTRLHFRGDKRTKHWKSRQEGLHHLAQGAFAGIRNIAAHDDAELTEHAALEQLAVLSVIARWADETELVTGVRP